jgi:hypothetical protein
VAGRRGMIWRFGDLEIWRFGNLVIRMLQPLCWCYHQQILGVALHLQISKSPNFQISITIILFLTISSSIFKFLLRNNYTRETHMDYLRILSSISACLAPFIHLFLYSPSFHQQFKKRFFPPFTFML